MKRLSLDASVGKPTKMTTTKLCDLFDKLSEVSKDEALLKSMSEEAYEHLLDVAASGRELLLHLKVDFPREETCLEKWK